MTRSVLTGGEALVAATAVAALSVWYAPAPAAVPAGLLLAFVLPGLALTQLIRPRAAGSASSARSTGSARLARSAVERAVLVPALSLAVLVVGGLVLYGCGVQLNRESWTALTATVTLLAAATAMVRAGRSTTVEPASVPLTGRAALPVNARTLVPLALILALLGGAGWLSLTSAQAPARAGVTALGVLPDSAAVAADGTAGRSAVIDVTSGEPGGTGFVIRVHSSQPVPVEFDLTLTRRGRWSLPPGAVTIDLYRRGDLVPYRSVSLAGTA